ncbi:MAG: hypothetical protein HY040_02635 [Planctomycetes bacterium]|nr:hypothetical protein [Planctomycetota bacterium]
MKLSSRLERLKQDKQSKQAGHKSGLHERGMLSPATWLLLTLCLVLAGVGTLAVYEFFIWNKVPPELVGFWEVEEGPQKGASFEFFRKGEMEIHMKNKKKDISHKTRVVVKDKTILSTSKNPQTRVEKTSPIMIRELTADSLILEFEGGEVLNLVRLE